MNADTDTDHFADTNTNTGTDTDYNTDADTDLSRALMTYEQHCYSAGSAKRLQFKK